MGDSSHSNHDTWVLGFILKNRISSVKDRAGSSVNQQKTLRAATYHLGAGVISGVGPELRWTPVPGSFAFSRLFRNSCLYSVHK